MIDELINGFDDEIFGQFLNSKFSGSFSKVRKTLFPKKELKWEEACQLGIVKTLKGASGSNMPLLVVAAKLPDGETLKERSSRIKQFKLAKQVLDTALSNPQPGVEGVISQGLFVFYDDLGNFRLSLVYGKAEGTKLVWSTAKRLSFYVEAGHPNKTFRDRTALDWSTFDKLKEAFSVEKLTKEFYTRLFAWYQRAMDSDEVVFPNDIVKDKESGEVKSEQIIRMITRLMFVWFLKQKHLVPNHIFDPEKLKADLKNFEPNQGDNYYRAILQNLFFATLNTEISDREFAVEGNRKENEEHFGVKILYRYASEFALSEKEVVTLFSTIPFMNGGLFECLDRDNHYYDGFSRRKGKRAQVPNALFFGEKGLIPLLQQYNFTVEENSPGDEEVALDPEMLGKVFENLLGAYNPETKVAARNATGSFYTPREIVNYMVDESLIAYLKNTLATKSHEKENEEKLRLLFAGTEGNPFGEEETAVLDNALVSAKILDPACGSGAFPMGILLRMVELLRILRDIPEEASVYDLKLELIKNCIYGGDIQCIAVQISKLRFFISLVCEQNPTTRAKDNYGIHTLPNLETKFVAADSLIGLPEAGKNVLDLCTGDIAELKEQLFEIRRQHFSARSFQKKKELRKEDKKLRAKIKRTVKRDAKPDRKYLELLTKERGKVAEPKWIAEKPKPQALEMFDEFSEANGNPQGMFDENAKRRKQLDAEISREQKRVNLPTTVVDEIAELLASWDPYNQNASAPFSDPEWMFNITDGFDVVIGNPPYVRQEGIKEKKPAFAEVYECYKGTADLLVYFYEKGCCLLKENGVLTYITSNKYFRAGYGDKLRGFISKKMRIHQLIDFGDAPVFDATAYPSIIVMSKVDQASRLIESKRDACSTFLALNWTPGDPVAAFVDIFKNRAFLMDQSYLTSEGWKLEQPHIFELMQKLRDAGIPLGEYVDGKFYRGILTGFNEAFVIDRPTRDRLVAEDPNCDPIIKPYLRGRDVKRWCPEPEDLWLIFTRRGIDLQKYPSIQAHLEQYHERLEPKPKDWKSHPGQKWAGRKAGSYKWYELQDSIDYWKWFDTPKIILGRFMNAPKYCYDDTGHYHNDALYIIGGATPFLAGILNSKVVWWFLRGTCTDLQNGYIQALIQNQKPIPIPAALPAQQAEIEKLIERIMAKKKENSEADVSELEAEIDHLVYQLYGLTDEEIVIVESATSAKGRKAAKKAPAKKKTARKRKAKLPPSLPGWD